MKAAANHWSLKLSQEFATRLASIPTDETLHTVVLLKTSEQRSASHRQTPSAKKSGHRRTARGLPACPDRFGPSPGEMGRSTTRR